MKEHNGEEEDHLPKTKRNKHVYEYKNILFIILLSIQKLLDIESSLYDFE